MGREKKRVRNRESDREWGRVRKKREREKVRGKETESGTETYERAIDKE